MLLERNDWSDTISLVDGAHGKEEDAKGKHPYKYFVMQQWN
jgi:hypothetical protein